MIFHQITCYQALWLALELSIPFDNRNNHFPQAATRCHCRRYRYEFQRNHRAPANSSIFIAAINIHTFNLPLSRFKRSLVNCVQVHQNKLSRILLYRYTIVYLVLLRTIYMYMYIFTRLVDRNILWSFVYFIWIATCNVRWHSSTLCFRITLSFSRVLCIIVLFNDHMLAVPVTKMF